MSDQFDGTPPHLQAALDALEAGGTTRGRAIGETTFRVRPVPGSRLSVEVQIFPSDAAFRAAVRALYAAEGEDAKTHRLIGFCFEPPVQSRVAAVIYLPLGSLTADTLAHECGHAVMRLAHRLHWPQLGQPGPSNVRGRGDGARSHEELFCSALGTLVARITDTVRRRGLIP